MDKLKDHWINYHNAICSIDFYGSSSSKLMGVTGFRLGRQLITSDYVYSVSDCRRVKLRFYEADGLTVRKELSYSFEAFSGFLTGRKLLGNLGVAILELPDKSLRDTSGIKFCGGCNSIS